MSEKEVVCELSDRQVEIITVASAEIDKCKAVCTGAMNQLSMSTQRLRDLLEVMTGHSPEDVEVDLGNNVIFLQAEVE